MPESSIVNRGRIHSRHLQVTRRIAESLVDLDALGKESRAVYLSRTKLRKAVRSYSIEEPIEAFCAASGCRIVYPERMSLAEQVRLFNSADVFAGFVGSAFHSIMFRCGGRPAKCVYLGDGKLHINCDMIDTLMGNESVYIPCCEPTQGAGRGYVCDPARAIAGLRTEFGDRAIDATVPANIRTRRRRLPSSALARLGWMASF